MITKIILMVLMVLGILAARFFFSKDRARKKILRRADCLLTDMLSADKLAGAWWGYLELLGENPWLENYGFTLERGWTNRMTHCYRNLGLEKMSPELRNTVLGGPSTSAITNSP